MMSDELVEEKILTTSAAAEQAHQFVTMNGKVYSLRFHHVEEEEEVSVKEVDMLNEVEVSKVYHCDGLVLCVAKDNSKLVLWNPYLSQTRWIGGGETFNIKDRHAIGYSDDGSGGRRNHKILRFVNDLSLTFAADDDNSILPERKLEVEYQIYEIRSNSWRVVEKVVNPEGSIETHERGVSVKGNTYFVAKRHVGLGGGIVTDVQVFLLCFDFTKERFGPPLPLPFDSFDGFNGDIVTLSSFLRGDDEQLAVLFGGYESGFFEIWVTLTDVDPNLAASWSKFLRMEPGPFCSYGFKLYSSSLGGSFFVDEEHKLAVLFELDETKTAHKAFVFGQDGSFKSSFNLGQALLLQYRSPILTYMLCKPAAYPPLVCSYRPSFVQL